MKIYLTKQAVMIVCIMEMTIAYLIAKGFIKIIKDTTGIDDGEDEVGLTKLIKDKKDKENRDNKKEDPIKPEAILPGKQKQVVQDSVTKLDN